MSFFSQLFNTGRMTERISIYRKGNVFTNDFNEVINQDGILTTVWASKSDISSNESLDASQVTGFVKTKFIIRSSEVSRTITTEDKIYYNYTYYNIHSVREVSSRRHKFIELVAVKVSINEE